MAETFILENGDFIRSNRQIVQIKSIKAIARNKHTTISGFNLRSVTPTLGQDYYFYVFNIEGGGFVLVAGDDLLTPILGFSSTGHFDLEKAPCNLKAFIEGCTATMEYHLTTQRTMERPMAFSGVESTIAPLLGEIEWDQSYPWNDQCPDLGLEKAPVGCVATALSQIMRFYAWPNQGKGFHSYKEGSFQELPEDIPGREHSVNFEQQTYRWDLMPKQVKDPSTLSAEQVQELAKLCYHVGVAGNMIYSASGSGTLSEPALRGMRENFRYSRAARVVKRFRYNKKQWHKLVQNELEAGHPVYYAGAGTGGGHAFVVDGYNGNGMYHLNWGWNGLSNGYYALEALEPEGLGIGGGAGGGFNSMQEIILNLEPDKNDSSTLPAPIVTVESFVTKITGDGHSIATPRLELTQITPAVFNGEVALAVVPHGSQDTLVSKTAKISIKNLIDGSKRVLSPTDMPSMDDMGNLQDGRYNLILVYKETPTSGQSTKWLPLERGETALNGIPLIIHQGRWQLLNNEIKLQGKRNATLYMSIGQDPARVTLDGLTHLKYDTATGYDVYKIEQPNVTVTGMISLCDVSVSNKLQNGLGSDISHLDLSQAPQVLSVDICGNHLSEKAVSTIVSSLPYVHPEAPIPYIALRSSDRTNFVHENDVWIARTKGWKVFFKAWEGGSYILKNYPAYDPPKSLHGISIQVEGNGEFSLEGAEDLQRVPFGKKLQFKVPQNALTRLIAIQIDGLDVTEHGSFCVSGDHVVKAIFTGETSSSVQQPSSPEYSITYDAERKKITITPAISAPISIYNMEGICLYQAYGQEEQALSIDVSSWSGGCYIIRIADHCRKFILAY